MAGNQSSEPMRWWKTCVPWKTKTSKSELRDSKHDHQGHNNMQVVEDKIQLHIPQRTTPNHNTVCNVAKSSTHVNRHARTLHGAHTVRATPSLDMSLSQLLPSTHTPSAPQMSGCFGPRSFGSHMNTPSHGLAQIVLPSWSK